MNVTRAVAIAIMVILVVVWVFVFNRPGHSGSSAPEHLFGQNHPAAVIPAPV